MPLFTLLVLIVALGLVAWLVRAKMPESMQPFKAILVWVLVAVAIWFVLDAFGVIDVIRGIRVPRA